MMEERPGAIPAFDVSGLRPSHQPAFTRKMCKLAGTAEQDTVNGGRIRRDVD